MSDRNTVIKKKFHSLKQLTLNPPTKPLNKIDPVKKIHGLCSNYGSIQAKEVPFRVEKSFSNHSLVFPLKIDEENLLQTHLRNGSDLKIHKKLTLPRNDGHPK